MIIIQALRGAVEALATSFYRIGCSRQHGLYDDHHGFTPDKINADLERPWQDFQALVAGTIAATIMTVVNEVNARGLGSVPPNELGDFLERLPLAILNEADILVHDGDGDE